MWLFIEFIPELLTILKDIKKKLKNPFFFFAFLSFLILLYYNLFVLKNYALSLSTISLFFIFSLIVYFKEKQTIKKSFYPLQYNLLEANFITKIKYSDIFKQNEYVYHIVDDTYLTVILTTKNNGVYIKINYESISTLDLSHLKMIICGIFYRNKFIDKSGLSWCLVVRLWGIFNPRILVSIKRLK